MNTTTRSGRCRTALTIALLSVLLAGCGGNDSASGHDATPAAGGSDGATSSTSPSPTVAAATGDVVETSFFSAHVPKGWRVDQTIPDFSIVADDPDGGSDVAFGIAKTYNNDFTLGQLAHQTIRSYSWEGEHLDIDLHSSLAGRAGVPPERAALGRWRRRLLRGQLRGPARDGRLRALRAAQPAAEASARGLRARQLAVEVTGA